MNHQDAYIADVLVVLECDDQKQIPPVIEQLTLIGMSVEDIDNDNAVVQGSIDASKVKSLEKVAYVRYCRVLETYIADFPTSDPRDLDGTDDASRAE